MSGKQTVTGRMIGVITVAAEGPLGQGMMMREKMLPFIIWASQEAVAFLGEEKCKEIGFDVVGDGQVEAMVKQMTKDEEKRLPDQHGMEIRVRMMDGVLSGEGVVPMLLILMPSATAPDPEGYVGEKDSAD